MRAKIVTAVEKLDQERSMLQLRVEIFTRVLFVVTTSVNGVSLPPPPAERRKIF